MIERAQVRTEHPWHPVFVHFPIACWIIALAVELLFYFWPQLILPGALAPGPLAAFLIWTGNAIALVAMGFGVIDMMKLPDEKEVISTVYKHMAWMTSAWLLMLVAGGLRVIDRAWAMPAHEATLCLELVAVGCLIIGGFQASHLVYHLHLGKKT